MLDSWKSPYRRALLIQSLSIKSSDDAKLKLLAEDFPEMLKNLFDALGTSLVNVSGKSVKHPIKSLFNKSSLRKDGPASLETGLGNMVKLPDGRTVRILSKG